MLSQKEKNKSMKKTSRNRLEDLFWINTQIQNRMWIEISLVDITSEMINFDSTKWKSQMQCYNRKTIEYICNHFAKLLINGNSKYLQEVTHNT